MGFTYQLLFFFFTASASAHQLDVFVAVDGITLRGEANYHAATPARECTVKALDPHGEVLAETRTDAEGKFTLPLRFRCDHRIVVDAGDGHGGTAVVEAEHLPADLPPWPGAKHTGYSRGNHTHSAAPSVNSAPSKDALSELRSEVKQLRKAIHHYERQLRFRDVLGGIGYIFGIAGLGCYLLSFRRSRRAVAPDARKS